MYDVKSDHQKELEEKLDQVASEQRVDQALVLGKKGEKKVHKPLHSLSFL